MHEQPVFQNMVLFKGESYPVAEELSKRNIFQTPELAEVYKRTKNYEPIFSDLIQAFCASKPSMRIEIFLYAVVNFINAK